MERVAKPVVQMVPAKNVSIPYRWIYAAGVAAAVLLAAVSLLDHEEDRRAKTEEKREAPERPILLPPRQGVECPVAHRPSVNCAGARVD